MSLLKEHEGTLLASIDMDMNKREGLDAEGYPKGQNPFYGPHIGGGFIPNFGAEANQLTANYLKNQAAVGTAPRSAALMKDAGRSKLEQVMGGSLLNQDGHPDGPGFAYFNHLFRRMDGDGKIKEAKKEKMTKGSNIYTEAQEAIKVAIKALGVATSMNPTGLPIDISDAKRLWFGEDDVDENEVLQWRNTVEMGDAKVDPKKVRKFTNYDGSLTWEILNDDKTVSSRFTLGEYAGVKVFSQGGYNKFVELMEKVKQQVGMDDTTSFESARSMFNGV